MSEWSGRLAMKHIRDVVIIGAGIIGLCSALQIARRARCKVTVLERAPGIGAGSTGASSAVCRAKYSLAETVVLAREGIRAYRNWPDFVGLSDPAARYHRHGNLWIGDGDAPRARRDAERLRALQWPVEVLDDVQLKALFPAINPCPIAPDLVHGEPHICDGGGGHLLETEAGYVEPMDAAADLVRALRTLGVEFRFGTTVQDVRPEGGALLIVSSEGDIACGAVINAAGPWCRELDAMVGLTNPWPLKPTRIQIVQIERPGDLAGMIPVCGDPAGGIYFRTGNNGRELIVGSVLEEDEREAVDPDRFDRTLDAGFAAAKLHALQHRLPQLTTIRGVRGYSGLYTMNRADVHPIVGATPVPGYFVANGCSGHGFKLAPAIGAMIARAVTGTALPDDPEVDPAFLAFERAPIPVASLSVLA
ncbi:sarcosine oxidase subunit beta [Allosphingosinicella indica]|uniref:Sarcosine oxidase subunit beta n=2 Tax=Allosphingosinicella indica TaxID=941907 RepID=A0A1X7FYK9_9SPHN|nr:sarcosine oxidase subunit beta [Allosphingosinicella indica]